MEEFIIIDKSDVISQKRKIFMNWYRKLLQFRYISKLFGSNDFYPLNTFNKPIQGS